MRVPRSEVVPLNEGQLRMRIARAAALPNSVYLPAHQASQL